jgi:hypothetical protein
MRDAEFKRHILDTYNISEGDFGRLIEEFLEHFDSTLNDYVRSRHSELQKEGGRNTAIYRVLMREIEDRRFAAGPLTERKIRRIIYG